MVKRAVAILSLLVVMVSGGIAPVSANGQGGSPQVSTITLYSKNKYKEDSRADCFNFDAGALVPDGGRCDIYYGTLYAGDDFDWFQSGATAINRSLIKDLGLYSWTDTFTVPVIEPLPKLKPGEQLHVTIDTSGADGADGLPGKPAVNGDGTVQPTVVAPPSKPKNDGKPKIDPIFVKAIAGHMYLIHVVDQSSDFYALFRVESVERGDKCTISWRKIPAPQDPAGEKAE